MNLSSHLGTNIKDTYSDCGYNLDCSIHVFQCGGGDGHGDKSDDTGLGFPVFCLALDYLKLTLSIMSTLKCHNKAINYQIQ